MKRFKLSRKTIVIASISSVLLLFFAIFQTTYGMTHYQKTDFVTGLVTASALYVRSGPRQNI